MLLFGAEDARSPAPSLTLDPNEQCSFHQPPDCLSGDLNTAPTLDTLSPMQSRQ